MGDHRDGGCGRDALGETRTKRESSAWWHRGTIKKSFNLKVLKIPIIRYFQKILSVITFLSVGGKNRISTYLYI